MPIAFWPFDFQDFWAVVVFPCFDLLLLEEVCEVFFALLEWLVLDLVAEDLVEVDFLELDFVELLLVVAIAGLTASNATSTNPNCG